MNFHYKPLQFFFKYGIWLGLWEIALLFWGSTPIFSHLEALVENMIIRHENDPNITHVLSVENAMKNIHLEIS